MTLEAGGVRLRREDGVARVELDRPPVNVLDLETLERLESVLEGGVASEEVRILCLSGRGRAFCAGVSVRDHLPDRVEETLRCFGRVVRRLLDLPVPAVAAVHGSALGGGCELAAACDVVLAREDTTFGQPEIRLGVFPPAAAALLPRMIGRQAALEMILTGRTFDVDEARRAGLVQRVFPAESWPDDVEAYLSRLASLSRPVLGLAKRAVVEGLERPVREALDGAERLYLDDLMELRDPVEGLEAFLEDREPAWEDA